VIPFNINDVIDPWNQSDDIRLVFEHAYDEDDEEQQQPQQPQSTNSPTEKPSENNKKPPQKKQKPPKLDRLKLQLDETDEDFSALTQHREFYEAMYRGDDNDAFFDRTGRVEKKREMKKKALTANYVETYETLLAKQRVVLTQKEAIEKEVNHFQQCIDERATENQAVDELDAYMSGLNVTLEKDKLTRKKKTVIGINKRI